MYLKSAAILLLIFISGCSSSDDEKNVIPEISIPNIEHIEGDEGFQSIDLNISLKEVFTEDIIISYESEDASAFQVLDYKNTSGQLSIPAGTLSVSIPLEIAGDQIKEGNEEFRLIIEADKDVKFNQKTAKITILDNDSKMPYDTDDYETPLAYAGWKLSWADEFNGSEINKDWWTHETGGGGWGNNELEYYTDQERNSRTENGTLIIEARNDTWNGHQYTSARMITRDKKTFHFGRVDIRAKLPKGQGIWPALWMLGTNLDTKGWPACGETDIMELIGNDPNTTHSTVHFGPEPANHKYTGKAYSLAGEDFSDRFHVFSLVWENNQMWFYVDDIAFYSFSSKETQGLAYPFNEPSFFIFNVAIGGNWPGNPDDTTVFPQKMLVDYIRVFEKE